MKTFIAIIMVLFILVLAILYIYKTKKKGQKCIGCPYAKECSKEKCL